VSDRVTIEDVAALARVSIKTVSRVINDEPNVSAATRDKVEKAIGRLKFRPSRAAKSLASRKAFTISLLYDNPCAHYVANVQTGVLSACEKYGYDLIIHPRSSPGYELAREVISLYHQARFDGVLLTPPLCDNATIVAALADEGIPTTLIAPGTAAPIFPSVVTNDEGSSFEMTNYLLSLGHRRIAFISGHPAHLAVQQRTAGFLRAMTDAGIAIEPELIATGFNSFTCGIEAGKKLLSLPEKPTAIFAANDEMAAGVLTIAHENQLIVPRDLSLVGFDDIPLATQLWPALTTVGQPIKEMASRATEMLLEIVSGKGVYDASRVEKITSKLIHRQSTTAYLAT
jgi:LacI family transcriptional regulator